MTKYHGHHNCVYETVRGIIRAQDEVANNNGNGCCTTSCEKSISELLSPAAQPGRTGFSTIPFILYCKGDCQPFMPSGVFTDVIEGTNDTFLNCIQSPILRVKGFTDEDENCVRVELLTGVNNADEVVKQEADTVCGFFEDAYGERARNLMATGICLTLDLDCFCAIQCLDPVNPLPASMLVNG
ncbi:hypothetical protein JNUCC1_02199 [Lentibacillus sp. JNUCC-1]|uniref:CotY/CotZ family spore coat protein n=1 Tax=Lentibacillus sp. JNUCC-1 TaxID=2654513 RepID=UPI0012E850A5|nr:CotY/CotZ family spore coat protein [Lentibacillus sp. JNUCC-1]MUV38361.1 hypothetical protein [Lentibacillus sp. JNUCC-1]